MGSSSISLQDLPSSLIVYMRLLDTSLEVASQTSITWLPLLQLSFGGVCEFKCKPDMDGIPLGAWSSASALECLGGSVLVSLPYTTTHFSSRLALHLHNAKASFCFGINASLCFAQVSVHPCISAHCM